MLMSSIRDLYLENQDTHLHHLVFNQSIYWKRSPMFSRGQSRRGDWSVDIGRALKVNRCGHSSYVASMKSSSSGVVHNKACSSEQTPKRHVLWWGWDICGFQYEHNWWLHKKENLYFDFLWLLHLNFDLEIWNDNFRDLHWERQCSYQFTNNKNCLWCWKWSQWGHIVHYKLRECWISHCKLDHPCSHALHFLTNRLKLEDFLLVFVISQLTTWWCRVATVF